MMQGLVRRRRKVSSGGDARSAALGPPPARPAAQGLPLQVHLHDADVIALLPPLPYLSGFRVPEGKYYFVDGGYANTPKFLAPYRNVRYHLKEQARGNCRPRDYKELFNLRHARLRNIIERIIGILKMRFPILKVATHYPIDTQVKIPLVAMVLHNIIRSQRGDEEWLKTQKMHIHPSKYVDVPSGDMTLRDDSTPSESRRKLGNALRDKIAKKMWADYERNRALRVQRRSSR